MLFAETSSAKILEKNHTEPYSNANMLGRKIVGVANDKGTILGFWCFSRMHEVVKIIKTLLQRLETLDYRLIGRVKITNAMRRTEGPTHSGAILYLRFTRATFNRIYKLLSFLY